MHRSGCNGLDNDSWRTASHVVSLDLYIYGDALMLSVVDCIFIGTGFLLCTFMVMLIMLIRSFRRVPSHAAQLHRAEPVMQPVPRPVADYVSHSPWDADAHYEGFTGVVHLHGVKTGDMFRAVIADNNSKCRLEKMMRVRG